MFVATDQIFLYNENFPFYSIVCMYMYTASTDLFPSGARALIRFQLNYSVCACVPAKSADLAHFQHAIFSGCWEPWLPDSLQAWYVLGATQVWATCVCAKASACMRYL